MGLNVTKTQRQIEFFRRYCKFWLACYEQDIYLVPYSFQRSDLEQFRLYKDGASPRDGYKRRSLHQDRLAMDAFVADPENNFTPVWDGNAEQYRKANGIAESFGLETGFTWKSKDSNHTQLPEETK